MANVLLVFLRKGRKLKHRVLLSSFLWELDCLHYRRARRPVVFSIHASLLGESRRRTSNEKQVEIGLREASIDVAGAVLF